MKLNRAPPPPPPPGFSFWSGFFSLFSLLGGLIADLYLNSSFPAVDPSRLKFWNTEETIELIQLYKKYLPEFHKFGQRKMNVWQRVTEEMVSKGYGNFSWAECSAKFRSLRDR